MDHFWASRSSCLTAAQYVTSKRRILKLIHAYEYYIIIFKFLGNRYGEICETVMKLKEHKDALVRRSVIGLIPLLAQSEPTTFANNHLAACMNHLLSQLKKDKERAPGLRLLLFPFLSDFQTNF